MHAAGTSHPSVDNARMGWNRRSTREIIERLHALPAVERLLPALDGLAPCHLVGGAVRDLLRGEPAVDIDLVVVGDAPAVARALARRLDGTVVEHGRFATATLQAGALTADLASARRERYPQPGALPEVEPAGLEEDLARRDFTVNAMALDMSSSGLGRLTDLHGGRDDLDGALVRVLHERSFRDDPTRLLRAVRYEARLDGAIEPATERLAVEAVAAAALASVSGPRVRDELLDLLAEQRAPEAVGRLDELGLIHGLHPDLRADAELLAGVGLGSIETGADRALAGLAALCCADPDGTASFVERLGLTARSRDSVLRAARSGPRLAVALRTPRSGSELHALLAPEPPEALALALALGAPAQPVLRFCSELAGVALVIGGDDLIAAGAAPSPGLGAALDRALARKLDGELSGREAELRAALDELGALEDAG
jgi:tRNA nucleotidyltransferase (CCA-adding enzyme)